MRWHFGWLLITREQNLTLNLYPPEARTLFQCSNVRRGGYSGWHWATRVGTMLMMMSPKRRKVNGAVIFDVSAWLAGGNGDAAKKRKKFYSFFLWFVWFLAGCFGVNLWDEWECFIDLAVLWRRPFFPVLGSIRVFSLFESIGLF